MKIKNKVLALIAMTTILGCEFNSDKKEPFNILWLVAEDLSPFYLNAYGDPRAATPNLDRLAREGVVYTNNFSVSRRYYIRTF